MLFVDKKILFLQNNFLHTNNQIIDNQCFTKNNVLIQLLKKNTPFTHEK